MTRYIKTNDFLSELSKSWEKLNKKEIDHISIENVLDNTPTADVVDVVRCKDCVYYKDIMGYNCFHPKQEGGWNSEGGECLRMNPDDFCSYGKKVE